MDLIVEFLPPPRLRAWNQREWETFISENAKLAARALASPQLLAKVRAATFDFTDQTGARIAERLMTTAALTLKVGFYYRPWPAPSIAKEIAGGVTFNTAKRGYGAGSPGNIAHEAMHVLGYSHDGNQEEGNENTVPYRIGEWVESAVADGLPITPA